VGEDKRGALTTRVFAAGAWTLGGQLAVTLASLIATPFGIRALDVELYGVLALVNVVIGYAAFADLALGQASTKFAAEEFARRAPEREAAVVWTALGVVAVVSSVIAIALAAAAPAIMRRFFVLPGHLDDVAIAAVRVATIGFVAKNLAGVLNTPGLVRLRFRLDVGINSGPLVLQILLVPVVLWLGGGLVSAVVVMVCASVTIALLHGSAGMVLLPQLRRPRWDRALVGPMLRFGGHLVAASMVGIVLVNLERVLLVRLGSVTVLGFYTVSATLGGIVAMAPAGLMNPLFSSFSQLRALSKKDQLEDLYRRAQRAILLATIPLVVVMFAFVRPFLTLWAGPAFGRESTRPFCLLVFGVLAQLMTRTAKELLKAHGRTEVFLRFYLLELLPYGLLAAVLILKFGASGAALAYSLRLVADSWLVTRAASQVSGIRFHPFPGRGRWYLLAAALAASPLVFAPGANGVIDYLVLLGLIVLSLAAYAAVVWKTILTEGERGWIAASVARRLGRR
jgi:O-antigen/teichoic acid export membrane protein